MFDAKSSVVFDLPKGLVQLRGSAPRVVLPAEGIAKLCVAAGAQIAGEVGRKLGQTLGMSLASRTEMGELRGIDAVRACSPEVVLNALAGELALCGLGSATMERWGRALLVVLDGCPAGADADPLVEGVLSGFFESATGADADVVKVEREGERARFLVVGSDGAEKVRAWLGEGVSWADVLVRLHAVQGSAS